MPIARRINHTESFSPLCLSFSILSQELLNRHVSTAYSDCQIAILNGHKHLDSSKVVLVFATFYTRAGNRESKLIQVLSEHSVYGVTLNGSVSVLLGLFYWHEDLFLRFIHFSPLSLQTLNFIIFLSQLIVQRLNQVLIFVGLLLHVLKLLVVSGYLVSQLLVLFCELVNLVLEVIGNLDLLVVVTSSQVD